MSRRLAMPIVTVFFALIMPLTVGAQFVVTGAEVQEMNDTLQETIPAFRHLWDEAFYLQARHGKPKNKNEDVLGPHTTEHAKLPFPKMIIYDHPVVSACGKIELGNAFYCPADKSLYIDILFLTALAKIVVAQSEKRHPDNPYTDGSFASMAVIAHELGHAMSDAFHLNDKTTHFGKYPSPIAGMVDGMNDENRADCVAGAFAADMALSPDYWRIPKGLDYELQPSRFPSGKMPSRHCKMLARKVACTNMLPATLLSTVQITGSLIGTMTLTSLTRAVLAGWTFSWTVFSEAIIPAKWRNPAAWNIAWPIKRVNVLRHRSWE